ncbi:hypothetical protein D0864_08732 [Hortaea werneckii]|uniref:Uncharacterized protein n=1 Tax=Hortaea werneckii TaxID=91943 RepID=A0A3M7EV53_HORWE|nr:hypothetical protein D0864_08732 [Hortaea werneckii]
MSRLMSVAPEELSKDWTCLDTLLFVQIVHEIGGELASSMAEHNSAHSTDILDVAESENVDGLLRSLVVRCIRISPELEHVANRRRALDAAKSDVDQTGGMS